MDKFVLPVRPDIIREIGKRGVKEFKKDVNGIVKKNEQKKESSSPFGWGTVDDTIPINKKELKDICRNLNLIISQIAPSSSRNTRHYLEVPPPIVPNGKRVREEEVVVVDLGSQDPQKKIKIPTLLQQWHEACSVEYEKGALGLIPECFHQGGLPPVDEMVHTIVGQTLLNFCNFIKRSLL